jgi:hypothetical protein
MSAPAAKAFWEPVRTMAEIWEDWSKACNAWFSSSMSGVERAFRAFGRLRVTWKQSAGRLVGGRKGNRYFVPLLDVAPSFE